MAAGQTEGFTGRQKNVLATILVPAFMTLLSVSIINVTLPSIRSSLHAGTSGLQWVVSGYALVFGVFLVPAGRAGDLWGRGRLFVAGLTVFGLGSLLAALAPNILLLNLARLVMGVGSGLLNPQVTGMIQQFFTGQARGRAFGAFGGTIGVSVAIGPVLGGSLVALLGADAGWRWSFGVNVPIALGGVLAARRLLPEDAWRPAVDDSRDSAAPRRADFDPVGMVLLAVATTLVMVGFMEARTWGAAVLAVIAVGLAFGAAWVLWERAYASRGREPMVDLDLFRTRSFAFGATLIGVYFFGSTSVWLIVAQYMQEGLGHTAFVAGLIGLPSALVSAVVAPIAGRHIVRVGRVLVLWGLVVVVVGQVLSIGVALSHSHGLSEWWLLLTLGILGFGQAMVISPNQTLTLADVPLRYAGSAGGVLQTGQRLGTSMGIAVITSLVFGTAAGRGWDAAFAAGLAAVTLTTCVAFLFGVLDLRRGRREQDAPTR